jgi:hypothetical protein
MLYGSGRCGSARCVARSEKRKPKWGFRLADDIVMELQAQTVSLLGEWGKANGYKQALLKFEGQAVLTDGRACVDDLKRHQRGARLRKFSLLQFDGEPDWRLNLSGWRRPLNDDPCHLARLDAAVLAALQDGGIFTSSRRKTC